jgi:hypothetical protein
MHDNKNGFQFKLLMYTKILGQNLQNDRSQAIYKNIDVK